jgi:hypothetical protein
LLTDLATPAGRDPVRVGAKAAALAAARAAGVAVLPGFVVNGAASLRHMRVGAKTLPQRGSGGARLAVSSEIIEDAELLVAAGRKLGDRLVARSSTLLESSGEWSGAFTSYVDIAPSELPKAVAGCWASAFSVAALERQEAAGVAPGSFPMAVLVQPALQPEAGGWAEIGQDGSTTVHGIKGPPTPVMHGWETGAAARFDGVWSGEELIELVGIEKLESIRTTLSLLQAEMGFNRCEWALADRVWVLQVGRAEIPSETVTAPAFAADISSELVDIVGVVVQASGALGDAMVLPWALGGLPLVDVPVIDGGSATIDQARQLCQDLTEEVWGLPWSDANQSADRTMRGLLTGELDQVMPALRSLRSPDADKAARLLAILGLFREELVARGVVAEARDAWHLDLDSIEDALHGRPVMSPPRVGIGRWEPFVASVILAISQGSKGTPASPGIGAGIRAEIVAPHQGRSGRRAVVTASRPIPNLASLLWDAAGLVTVSGSPAAHLFESARALRLPAVCGLDLGPARDEIIAVDGHTGIVGRLELERAL